MNAYEAASAAWDGKTQAEEETIYLTIFGRRTAPWENDDDDEEVVDDGADLEYEFGPD